MRWPPRARDCPRRRLGRPSASELRRLRRKRRLALLAMRGDAFLRLRAAEAEHLERERGIERRPRHAQPVVERILGPAKRGLRASRELARDFQRLCLQLAFFASERYQAEALGLLAA